jgi:hypothetical protein
VFIYRESNQIEELDSVEAEHGRMDQFIILQPFDDRGGLRNSGSDGGFRLFDDSGGILVRVIMMYAINEWILVTLEYEYVGGRRR